MSAYPSAACFVLEKSEVALDHIVTFVHGKNLVRRHAPQIVLYSHFADRPY
jgi:hypothetical protein